MIPNSMTWTEINKEFKEIRQDKKMEIAGLLNRDDSLITQEKLSKFIEDLKDKGIYEDLIKMRDEF